MRYDIEPLNLIKGTGYSLLTHRGGKRTQMEMQAQILNSFSLTLTFAFGFALGLVTRVFPCICICVLYLHQMCEPFFPVHVLRRIRPNKCCKQTEKFSKVCLHHSNLSVSLENGIKKICFTNITGK